MQGRASITRAALITAAAEVVNEQGPEAAGVDRISRRAAVSKGAFYFHFPSKERLLAELVVGAREELRPLLERLRDQHGPLVGDVADFAQSLIRELRENPVLRAGMSVELSLPPGHRCEPGLNRLPVEALRLRTLRAGDELPGTAAPAVVGDLLAVVTLGLERLDRLTPGSASATADEIWQLLTVLLRRLDGVLPASEAGKKD